MIIWLATLLSLSFSAFAEKDFSSWRKFTQAELVLETTALSPGSQGTAGLHVTLAEGWHTYWVNPGDSGSGIRLSIRTDDGLKVRSVQMPLPKRFVAEPLISFAYANEVLFPMEIEVDPKVSPGSQLKLWIDAEWLVCADVCIPAIESLQLTVPVRRMEDVKPGPQFSLFQKTRLYLPKIDGNKPVRRDEGGKVQLEIPGWNPDEYDFVDFFPFKGAGFNNKKPEVLKLSPLTLAFEKTDVPVADRERLGVLVGRSRDTGNLEAWKFGDSGWKFETASAGRKASGGLLWMLLSAFLGGLILNLMPCVFPVLSIKLLSILKLAESHHDEVRAQNFAYVGGVLFSFLSIALVLAGLRSAGHLLGWGFQLQSPIFLSLLCWLFFLLALNLLGLYEIDFLNAGFGHHLTRLGGLSGSFFTGVLAVIVASPCTAPFMGVALGFGLSQPTPILLAVFLSLGLGLAFPYLIFAIAPRLVRFLPRPGAWMNWMRRIMALPLILTLIWLVWVLQQVRGYEAMAIVLFGCTSILLAVLMQSWLKRIAQIMAILIVISGLSYIYAADSVAAVNTNINADGLWKPYGPELLEQHQGQNVFINMTADWCLTCKVNEKLVFSDESVLELLKKKNVVLIKGDWTQRNEDITRFLNKYERVGVPFYVIYSPAYPEGLVLPEVLTAASFKDWLNKAIP